MQKSTSQLLRTACGLFGEPGSTLTPERAGLFASAFAAEYASGRILAAADDLPGAKVLLDALVPVLEDAGCDVLEITGITLPMAQFQLASNRCCAGLYAAGNGIRILSPRFADADSYWASLLPENAAEEVRRANLSVVLDCQKGAAEHIADDFAAFFHLNLIRTTNAANAAGKLAAAAGAAIGLCWNGDGTQCQLALPGAEMPLSPYRTAPVAARQYLLEHPGAALRNSGNDSLILEDFVQRHGGTLSAETGDFTLLPEGAFALHPASTGDALEMSAFFLLQCARGAMWDNLFAQLYPYHAEIRELPLETPRRNALLRSLRGRFGDGKAVIRSTLNFDWNDGRLTLRWRENSHTILLCSEAKKRKVARERLDLACKLLQNGGVR